MNLEELATRSENAVSFTNNLRHRLQNIIDDLVMPNPQDGSAGQVGSEKPISNRLLDRLSANQLELENGLSSLDRRIGEIENLLFNPKDVDAKS